MPDRRDDDLFEWTVIESEFGDTVADAEPQPPPVAPTDTPASPSLELRISRRVWLTIGGAVLAVLLLLGLNVLWERNQWLRTMQQAVTREDEALLAGDTKALANLIDPGAPALRVELEQRAQQGWQLFPSPNVLAGALSEPGTVRAVTELDDGVLQVEVVRPYSGVLPLPSPDAHRYVFSQMQFYRKLDGVWKRTDPPKNFWGDYQTFEGARLSWQHLPAEADMVRELGPVLDAMAVRACDLWACPPDLRVPLLTIQGDATQPNAAFPGGYGYVSDMLSVIQADQSGRWSDTLSVMAAPLTGLPRDAASTELHRRALGLRVLSFIIHSLHTVSQEYHRNHFAVALTAYTAVQLGLEPATTTQRLAPDPRFEPEELWATTSRDQFAWATRTRDALILLNRLLRDEAPEAAERLTRSLPDAADPVSWLATAFALTPAEAEARWQAARQPITITLPTDKPAAYAMNCGGTSLRLWSPGDRNGEPLLPDSVGPAWAVQWSPDGQRLLISIANERFAVADFPSRQLIWVPQAFNWPAPVWVSASMLAVVASPNNPDQSHLFFFDVANPLLTNDEIGGINSYTLSPDGSLALITMPGDGGMYGAIGVMPALGGEPRVIAQGYNPQWLPDSRAIVFTAIEAGRSVLKRAEVPGGEPTTILTPDQLPTETLSSLFFADELRATLAPIGDQIAVTATQYRNNAGVRNWIGLMPASGGEWRPVQPEPMRNGWVRGFSADGLRLAVLQQHGRQAGTLIFDAERGALLQTLPAFTAIDWTQSGHDLRLVSANGEAYLLKGAGDGDPQPERQPWPCGWAIANPVLAEK